MSSLNISILQYEVKDATVEERIAHLEETASGLKGGADLLICPELFLPGYHSGDQIEHCAQPLAGAWRGRIGKIAQDTGLAVLYGYSERADDRVYNSAACIGPDGGVLANHRKLHLPSDYEKGYFAVGDCISCFDLNGIRVGMLICYDGEFPEAARAAALSGVELLVVPTALVREWRQVAMRVMPTRAFENGIYLAYANYAGQEDGLEYCGLSCIADPSGLDLARAGEGGEVIHTAISTDVIAAAQKKLPYFKDRREGLAVVPGGAMG